MVQIQKFGLQRLKNAEYAAFMSDFDTALKKYPVAELGIADQYEQFQQLNKLLMSVIFWKRGSIFTDDMMEADQKRAKIYTAVSNVISSFLNSTLEPYVAAGEELKLVLKHVGDPRRKNYMAETGALDRLCAILQEPKYESHLNLCPYLRELVLELQKVNNEFSRLFDNRLSEKSEKPEERAQGVRLQFDALYSSMISKINAALLLEIAPAWTPDLVDLHHVQIKNYRTNLARRQGRRNAKKRREAAKAAETGDGES